MPRIVETTVFTIDELSDAAKENARIWYRDQGLHDEWYDFLYEDFEAICGILGITLATTPVRLYGGGNRDKPQIFWSGFSFQGDGASFAGYYSHARGAGRAIRAHAPQDTELHRDRGRTPGASTEELLATQCRRPTARALLPRAHDDHRGRAPQPDLAAADGRCRGRGDRGHARSCTLALPPAPCRVRAPDLGRSDRRNSRRE